MCGNKKDDQPTINQVPLTAQQTQQNELFSNVQVPWAQSQYKLYQDTYEPQARSLGNVLGEQLKSPTLMPDQYWNNAYQTQAGNITGQYDKLRQTGTERAAGSGMLGQGPTEKYMQGLDLAQGKSMEDMAVDMAIQQWTEKKTAQQQAISNMGNFVNQQPMFGIQPAVPQYYTQAPPQQTDWMGNITQGLGMVNTGMGIFGQGKDMGLWGGGGNQAGTAQTGISGYSNVVTAPNNYYLTQGR